MSEPGTGPLSHLYKVPSILPAILRHLGLADVEALSRVSKAVRVLLERCGTWAVAAGRPASLPPAGLPGPRWLQLYFHFFVVGRAIELESVSAPVSRYPEREIGEFEDWVPPLAAAERARLVAEPGTPVLVLHRCPRSFPELSRVARSALFACFRQALEQTTVLELLALEEGATLCSDAGPVAVPLPGDAWHQIRLHRKEAADPKRLYPTFWVSKKAALRRPHVEYHWRST